MRNKKQKRTMLLLLILLVVSVGYALLSTTLKINGTAGIKSNTWDIHWENVVPNQSSTITAETPTIGNDGTTVTYDVELSLPGDFYEFTVDAKNDGTINGKIDDIRHTVNEVTVVDEEEILTPTTLPSYILYTVVYDETETAPEPGNILEAGEKKTYRVRIEYDPLAEVLPSTDKVYRITDEIDYVQTKDKASVDLNDLMNKIVADPDSYRNPEQSTSNKDIGIDEDGNVINMDLWYDNEEEVSSFVGPAYYLSEDLPGDGYSDYLSTKFINLGQDWAITPATGVGAVENGRLLTPIPAYILIAGEDKFYPVEEISYMFGSLYGGTRYEDTDYTEDDYKLTEFPDLPSTIKIIGTDAFEHNNITSITISNNIREIDTEAFEDNQIQTIIYEDDSKLEYIGNRAFKSNELTSLTIPDSVKTIWYEAFMDNDITSITIPKGVTTISFGVFDGNKIQTLNFEENSTLVEIDNDAFSENNLTSITIPKSVKRLGSGAFEDNQIHTINFEANSVLEEIDDCAFEKNNLSGNFVLPQSVKSIGRRAFRNNNLTSITFPSTATFYNASYGNEMYDNSFDSGVTINHQY